MHRVEVVAAANLVTVMAAPAALPSVVPLCGIFSHTPRSSQPWCLASDTITVTRMGPYQIFINQNLIF